VRQSGWKFGGARVAKRAPHSDDEFVTAAEVARRLCVSVDWVYERAKSGELPSYKLPGGRRLFRWSGVGHARGAVPGGWVDAQPEGGVGDGVNT
jgi:excisionase family DNA binding protein